MTTIIDYNGRLSDINAYQGAYPGGERLLVQELVNETHGGMIVAGIQKVVQRFVIALLTEAGSVAHFPDRGCQFLTDAKRGYFQTALDVYASFSASEVDIRNQIWATEEPTDPADERYLRADLESVTVQAGSVSIRVKITTRSGDDYTWLQPIPVGA